MKVRTMKRKMQPKPDYASMFTLRKDGRYVYRYTDDFGKRHCIYDRDPERLYQKINNPEPEEEKVITFSDIADAWERRHTEEIGFKTAEAYVAPLRRLKAQFGDRPAEEITAGDIAAYLDRQGKQGYSRRAVQMSRDIVHMIYNNAILNGTAKVNPCTAVRTPRNLPSTRRELPDDEAIAAVKTGGGCTFGLFALICLYSGLRRGEVLALTYGDIDRQHKVIHVTKSVEFIGNNPHIKPPKTNAGNRDAILLDALAEQIPKGRKNDYIFARSDGGLLTKTQYRKRWKKYCEEIGHELTAHQLRHGFATILFEAGIDDKSAQELLGHASIVTTRDIYTHIRQTKRDETASILNDFLTK